MNEPTDRYESYGFIPGNRASQWSGTTNPLQGQGMSALPLEEPTPIRLFQKGSRDMGLGAVQSPSLLRTSVSQASVSHSVKALSPCPDILVVGQAFSVTLQGLFRYLETLGWPKNHLHWVQTQDEFYELVGRYSSVIVMIDYHPNQMLGLNVLKASHLSATSKTIVMVELSLQQQHLKPHLTRLMSQYKSEILFKPLNPALIKHLLKEFLPSQK